MDCARKHLLQSILCLSEGSELKWYALAHLAEAEEELVFDYTELAAEIRENIRLPLQEGKQTDPALFEAILRKLDINPSGTVLFDAAINVSTPMAGAAFHIAKACVLWKEAVLGYPSHKWLAADSLESAIQAVESLTEADSLYYLKDTLIDGLRKHKECVLAGSKPASPLSNLLHLFN
jgi:hypothetical protein